VASEPGAVRVRDLWVRFGDVPALRGLTFEVGQAERLAILGPNGAGKTTLLRALAGLLRPGRGQLLVAGLDPSRQARTVRARLGVLSHQTYLYGEFTAAENLRLYGRLYGLANPDERIGELLERVGLYGRRNDRVDTLSRGLQQRLAVARAILHRPAILLLDEPDTGLDLPAYQLLESLIVLVDGRLVGELPAGELERDRLAGLYGAPLLAAG